MSFFDRLFPYPSSGAGVPGLANRAPRRWTEDEKAASAAAFLARHAAKKRAAAKKRPILEKCEELRSGPVCPIAPRDQVVAAVRGRREARHG